jgi:hypothetical protein
LVVGKAAIQPGIADQAIVSAMHESIGVSGY